MFFDRLVMRNQLRAVALRVLLLMLCNIPAKTESTAPMQKTEKEALFTVIQGFAGDWWNGSELYPDPCGWTPIEGVQCDLFGDFWFITVLSIGPIHDNSIECTKKPDLRNELFSLKELKSLSVFSCFVSSSHPFSLPSHKWENLAGSLEAIDFRQNPYLVGEIPANLGCLKKLQSLVLIENGLTGPLPTSLGYLLSLKRLVLTGNKLSGQIPITLGGLNQLLILDLSMNYLSGSLHPEFGNLTSLLKLDLSQNFLVGNLPEELSRLKNLTLLDLRNNRFSGQLPESFSEMVSLEEMLLGKNPLGGDLLSLKWQNLQSLLTLDLSNSSFTGTIPESLTDLKKLRFLGLENNQFSGQVSQRFAYIPCISTMHLNGNNLTGTLDFPQRFYEKMGTRFTVWNNPDLCYPFKLPTLYAPYGLISCEEQVSHLSSEVGHSEISSHSNPSSIFTSLASGSNVLGEFLFMNILLAVLVVNLLRI